MLRLLPPPGSVQEPRKPRSRPALTPDESARLRVVLKNLHRTYGTWACLADAMGISKDVLKGTAIGRWRGSYTTVVLAARVGRIQVEEVLSGKLTVAGKCPTCGRCST